MPSTHPQLIKLAHLPQSASIRVISPASFANRERVDRGVEHLRELGFTPMLGNHTLTRGPLFFAGEPAQRLDDLHAAFADPATDIIASVRGGYGSNYLLDGLDLALLQQHAKPFFAYSDLTGIQLYLLDHLGLPAFHGPMVAADFAAEDGVHDASLLAALAGEPYALGPPEGLRTLKPGTAQGTLYGGCLSILVALIGTPWEPATEGKLLFLEDTGAKPYQIDRMLWQLRAAGKFDGLRGIVFGEMLNCVSPGAPTNLLEDVILRAFRDLDIPIAIGLRSGHVSRQNVTLTFGGEAEFEATGTPQLHLQPVVNR
ncbi:MAG TPA: LD-carboxypeptidase [Terracidiphilus sp.]|jgi:muramoyltetrapeptide carboxypeptidase|nr:LD-carboxypeptidase [Terracidiphilus sp.]